MGCCARLRMWLAMCGSGHALGGADECFRRFVIEEIEVLEVMVFRTFENVKGDAVGLTGVFVDGVEEVEEEAEPAEDDVEFGFGEGLLWGGLVAEGRNQ